MKKWIMVLGVQALLAQSPGTTMFVEGRAKIDQGIREWNPQFTLEARSIFERAIAAEPNNSWAMYWKAYANYRLAIQALYSKERDEKAAQQYVEDGISDLNKALEISPSNSEMLAVLGSFTGMKIQFSPVSAMWLGPKSNEYLTKSIESNDKNPRAYYLKGIGTMNTPSMFGGGADKSIAEFETAIALFEIERKNTPADPLQPAWGLDDCHSFLGNAYEKVKNPDQAKLHYQKALEINPDSRRAKMELAKLDKK